MSYWDSGRFVKTKMDQEQTPPHRQNSFGVAKLDPEQFTGILLASLKDVNEDCVPGRLPDHSIHSGLALQDFFSLNHNRLLPKSILSFLRNETQKALNNSQVERLAVLSNLQVYDYSST